MNWLAAVNKMAFHTLYFKCNCVAAAAYNVIGKP